MAKGMRQKMIAYAALYDFTVQYMRIVKKERN